MEILRCEGVTKAYGKGENAVHALRGIDLTVEKGEFAAIIGASGSGKSTLLHILGAVDSPTRGSVWVDGQEISTLSPREAALFRRRKVGLIYQFYNLIPTLSVERNIKLPLLLDKTEPETKSFEAMIQTLGLCDKLNALPSQLSGGQQQRTAIARSLLYRPVLLLADEPTGNLDQENSREIMALLKRFNRKLEQTILVITHDELVAKAADRIIRIEDGRIVSDAPAR
ncbi:putative ABC transport system ATP-binding protein [Eubacterium maltosivorans]|uniref:ABC transporter ATP-binding protein n=1 Tax=Eubacterium maltosivorans TaxID=2041044 RepID=UPI0008821FB1|nr:ABC transporter ATP-binding protein [Eubacterium maltosivorans]WPK80575.1 Lipoprotein-releasing system ATP-binding protein LolD [Eubacterium maltosivorans]SDO22665.1 putative ABC transport system ATP-binding protein [Eubacterium maltosivorans]